MWGVSKGWARVVARGTVLGVVAAASLLTAGCSAAVRGAAGLTLDEGRRPIAVLAGCDGEVTEVWLGKNSGEEPHPVIGRWQALPGPLRKGPVRLTMPAPDARWQTVIPLGAMQMGEEFDLGGAIRVGLEQLVLESVQFSLRDWGQLGPGKVLMGRKDTEKGQAVVSDDEFARRACSTAPG